MAIVDQVGPGGVRPGPLGASGLGRGRGHPMTAGAAVAGPPVDVLGDGRLLKELLVAGSGDLPTAGAQVRVHYECKLSGSDEVVDSSYARGETFVAASCQGAWGRWRHVCETNEQEHKINNQANKTNKQEQTYKTMNKNTKCTVWRYVCEDMAVDGGRVMVRASVWRK